MLDRISFYKNKKVLITGHTGFKGSWMCKVLLMAGAQVTGYALEPPTEPSLFEVLGFRESILEHVEDLNKVQGKLEAAILQEAVGDKPSEKKPDAAPCYGSLKTILGDICDLTKLQQVFALVQPEIVIHMAAQPLVRESYKDPVGTYAANVMGTVHVLECVRQQESVKSFVNVTTDKVYLNREWEWGYRENEELNGYDPYSNSKSCSELVTSSYKNSFFGGAAGLRANGKPVAITTMRAGNVIGGGDFALDRIVPDCIRAVERGEEIIVRNPHSTRPYQHVLEPVMAYLMVAARQYEQLQLAGCYNVGPEDEGCYTTGNLVDMFCKAWNQEEEQSKYYKASWKNVAEANAPHEANFLKLDCTKLKTTFGWKPVWTLEEAMKQIVLWSKAYLDSVEQKDYAMVIKTTEKQILDFWKD